MTGVWLVAATRSGCMTPVCGEALAWAGSLGGCAVLMDRQVGAGRD